MPKKYIFSFVPTLVERPLTFRLVKDFGLEINILRAEINEKGGTLIVTLDGSKEKIADSIKFLEDNNVQVRELKRYVGKDDGKCTDCGVCVSICPVRSYEVERPGWNIIFRQERCIACGICLDACPSSAIFKVEG